MGRIHHQVALPLCHTLQNPLITITKKNPLLPAPYAPARARTRRRGSACPPPLESFGPRARCRAGLPRSIGRGGVFECRVRAARRRAPFLAALLPPRGAPILAAALDVSHAASILGNVRGRADVSLAASEDVSLAASDVSLAASILGILPGPRVPRFPEIPVGLARSEIDEGGLGQ